MQNRVLCEFKEGWSAKQVYHPLMQMMMYAFVKVRMI